MGILQFNKSCQWGSCSHGRFCSVKQFSPTEWSWRVSQGPSEDESLGKCGPVRELRSYHIAADVYRRPHNDTQQNWYSSIPLSLKYNGGTRQLRGQVESRSSDRRDVWQAWKERVMKMSLPSSCMVNTGNCGVVWNYISCSDSALRYVELKFFVHMCVA